MENILKFPKKAYQHNFKGKWTYCKRIEKKIDILEKNKPESFLFLETLAWTKNKGGFL